jgi:glycosidase
MTRILSSLNGDVAKLKMAILWLMTCRGIPQMYYGTEILMKGVANPDGWVRLDFPGGWVGDAKNAFTGVGMSNEELAMQQFVALLAHYRKQTSALQSGKLMQYLPKEGLYVYFRYDQNKTIMCIMNTDDKERMINFNDYSERTNGFQKGKDIVEQQIINDHFLIPAHQMRVLELIH